MNYLYHVEIVAWDGDRAKIHYIGYGEKHDQWRNVTEIIGSI